MLVDLQAEETRLLANTLLATAGRHMTEKEVEAFHRDIAPTVAQRRPKAPRVTAGFLGSISTVKMNMAEGGEK